MCDEHPQSPMIAEESLLWAELCVLIGNACARVREGHEVDIAEYATRALLQFKRRFALLAVGDTITTPWARVVVRIGEYGLAEAVLEGVDPASEHIPGVCGPDKVTIELGIDGDAPPEGFEGAEVVEAKAKLRLS